MTYGKFNESDFIKLSFVYGFNKIDGITMIQSKSSGKFYATSKRIRIASTFDLETAKYMIGQ